MTRLTAAQRLAPAAAPAGAAPSLSGIAGLCLLTLALANANVPARADEAPGPDAGAAQAAATEKGDAEFFAQNAQRPGVVALRGGGQALKLSGTAGEAAAGAQMVVVNLSRRGLHEAPPPVQSDTPVGVQNARYRTQNLPRPLFEAVQLMHVGERWEIFTPAAPQVTGAKGKPGRKAMPASVFTLELLSAK